MSRRNTAGNGSNDDIAIDWMERTPLLMSQRKLGFSLFAEPQKCQRAPDSPPRWAFKIPYKIGSMVTGDNLLL